MQTETKLEISELLFQFTLASVSECVISSLFYWWGGRHGMLILEIMVNYTKLTTGLQKAGQHI